MADKTELKEQAMQPAVPAAKVPMLPMLGAMVVSVAVGMAGVGSAGWWLLKSGRLPVVQGATAKHEAVASEPLKTRLVSLEPLLVNLADDGGHSYLRLALTLRLEELPLAKGEKPKEEKPEKGKPANENEAAMRDAALAVLGHETSTDLLADGGKERLKQQLRAALAERLPAVKIDDVLFTEFLVQR